MNVGRLSADIIFSSSIIAPIPYVSDKDKSWYNNRLYNKHYGKYESNIYNNTQNKQHYQIKSIDPTLIKQELNSRIKDLAHQFLVQPHSQKPTEWRYGNKGSISIHVAGTKQEF